MSGIKIDPQRVAGSLLLGTSITLLWQAWGLEDLTVFGPGPGLFPKALLTLGCLLSALLIVFPSIGVDRSAQPDEEPPLGPAERRTYFTYIASFFVLVIGSAYMGFVLTCVAVAILVIWFGARHPLRNALFFGATCGIVGIVGFGHYMQVELPVGPIDQMILRWLR